VTDALRVGDGEAIRNYGQEQLAQAVGRAKWMYDADFVGARPYYVAAKLAYGAGSDAGIMSLSDDIDQFYFWHDVNAYTGKTALIVSDVTLEPNYFARKFDTVRYVGSVTPTRFGHALVAYHLYLGRGFHGMRPAQ
jgi:hypothetical protein